MSSRFYCGDQPLTVGQRVDLPDEESRHLLKTMRARVGDELVVFGGGNQFAATLVIAEGRTATVEVGEPVSGPPDPQISMKFLIPWIKGGKTDFLVQKLTELGAKQIVVFQAQREVAKGDDSKIDRLERIALEACKQCERISVPEIKTAKSIRSAFEQVAAAEDFRVVLHEREGSQTLSRTLAGFTSPVKSAVIASGPEGGWHPEELKELETGTAFISLGPRILRAETAPLIAAAAILAHSGEI